MSNAVSQVFLMGTDITSYLESIPYVKRVAPDYGQLITNELPELAGINRNGFWDVLNDSSPFFEIDDVTTLPVQLYQNGVLVFDGYIDLPKVNQDYFGASVAVRSVIARALDLGCSYFSAAPESPSQIVKSICNQYGIPIDFLSFAQSNAFYGSNNVACLARVGGDLPIMQVFQSAAQVGCARIYVRENRLAFDAYQLPTYPPLITLTTQPTAPRNNVITDPSIEPLTKESATGIKVVWFGGSTERGSITAAARSISGGPNDAIQIINLSSAVFLGDLWLSYLRKRQAKVTLGVPNALGLDLDIGIPCLLDYAQGFYTVTFDIVSVETIDSVETMIVGYTRG